MEEPPAARGGTVAPPRVAKTFRDGQEPEAPYSDEAWTGWPGEKEVNMVNRTRWLGN